MEALIAFATAVLALRLAGRLAGRARQRRRPELVAWSSSLFAFAVAAGALAWGSAAGWGEAAFRIYYLFGGLLTAPLLAVGSLLLVGRGWARPAAILYTGLAIGVALAAPLTAAITGTSIPDAGEHLEFFPARLVALVGNVLGTVIVAIVALGTIRRRPLGNSLILAGVTAAAAGSALFGLGAAESAASLAVAVSLLYAGFLTGSSRPIKI